MVARKRASVKAAVLVETNQEGPLIMASSNEPN